LFLEKIEEHDDFPRCVFTFRFDFTAKIEAALSLKTLVPVNRLHEIPRVEAGSNTSTVTLRVVGGDEKGSLESETVKYGHES
jgi:hypothetical protein